MRSSSGASAQWMSSKSRIERLDVRERRCITSRAAQAISCGLRSPSSASMQARREPEHVGDGVLRAALAQLLERLLERIVVRDAGGRLDHLRRAAST